MSKLTIQNINHTHDFFLYIDNFFNPNVALEIWGDDWKHYSDKYLEHGNAIIFWQTLDVNNKQKLIDWYEKHYEYPN